ncbi:uncharacterized protein SCHCODRAFT_02617352 [Schizophyllum commune H4-8]|uniref:uncharacterized protein n=1 Tax=Schizophyllum commune (strain H4-8 / FGSC 9210) TaxID=578458 RepID=UPI00215F83CC|nr:uncharacterized protein SCHCODRAFT_02617352 [Schizophyllum commune H4-8]KAI5894600.1 hypothetical protein SCHCODRAFT_02617352 [Schizophyllum commune H4-8]
MLPHEPQMTFFAVLASCFHRLEVQLAGRCASQNTRARGVTPEALQQEGPTLYRRTLPARLHCTPNHESLKRSRSTLKGVHP